MVIPTYGRDSVLCDTIRHLRSIIGECEILVVDQSPKHDEDTVAFLSDCATSGQIRWVKRAKPSIPESMNAGLKLSNAEIVLFLDDDIVPDKRLIDRHIRSHEERPEASAIVGQVLQPGEIPRSRGSWKRRTGFLKDLDFPYWSIEPAQVSNVMAGNLSVKRELALRAGGFDENFDGVAYRFETEFARRLERTQGPIFYEPNASIMHLRAARGGTRLSGSHLTSASPKHGAGDYYFAIQSGVNCASILHMLKRPFREVRTKFHLTHPWYIPVKLIGEARAFAHAVHLSWRGPKQLQIPIE